MVSFVSNAAMHHLLLGIDSTDLLTPPCMPTVFEAMEIPASSLLPIHPDGALRILPNIGGFVGGHTVGCMLAADFGTRKELTLMIDIGTNIEIVLGNCDRRVACSVIAADVSASVRAAKGMPCSHGTADHVWLSGEKIRYHSIGGTAATSLYGSGFLELVSCLMDLNVINEAGRLNKTSYVLPRSSIVITQEDIREVQQMKTSIRSGIHLLCSHLKVTEKDIQNVLLAGTFGSSVNPKAVCRIGIIPSFLQDRITNIGNAADEGAKLCALSKDAFEHAKKLAEKTEYLNVPSLAPCFD